MIWLAGAAGAAAALLIGKIPPGATTQDRSSVTAPDASATAAAGISTCASTSTAVHPDAGTGTDGTDGGVPGVPSTTAIPQPPALVPVSFTYAITRSMRGLLGSAAVSGRVCAVRVPKR